MGIGGEEGKYLPRPGKGRGLETDEGKGGKTGVTGREDMIRLQSLQRLEVRENV